MENKDIFSSVVLLDDFYEQKTEFDIVIPDYSPAAEKILCCDVNPCVLSKKADDDSLRIEYECQVSVVYTDENGIVHSVTESNTDEKVLSLSTKAEKYRIKAGIRPITVNCRLANPRRITVRAVMGMAVKATGNMPFGKVGDYTALEAQYQTVNANSFVACSSSTARVNGSVDVGEGVTDIISSRGFAIIEDIKPITDKLVIKGSADVYVVFTTGEEKENLKFKKFTIPFSDVINAEGTQENSIAEVSAEIFDLHCETGEGNEIIADGGVIISASVYTPAKTEIMTDAYSMELPVTVKKSKLTVESLYDRNNFNETVSANVSCDLAEARIVGIYPQPVVKGISLRDGMLVFEGELYLKIYMYNENEYKISDKTMPFSFSRPLIEASGNLRCEAEATVNNVTYNMPDDNTLTVTATLNVSLNCFSLESYDAVESIEVGENEQKTRKGIVLYSANKGERLWDIAKKLCSSVEIIKRDNGLVTDTVEDSSILLVSFK